ncbi:MAG: histidine--tRNA ligase [Proteocatella sp.]
MKIQKPKGTDDILPSVISKWYYVEDMFKQVCHDFGYKEIRTPVFEYTDLFKRGVGDTTDIVQKEMFNLEQRINPNSKKKPETFSLKPEGTAPVVRAYIENSLYANPQPTKLFYNTPCFRYEQPQEGRKRAFHQFGVEVFSSTNPYTDAEVIGLAMEFFRRLGIDKNLELRINSVGTMESRGAYSDKLRGFLEKDYDRLCDTCKDRFHKNPMRIIDCKNETCKEISKDAPLMIDNLSEESKANFEKLKECLDIMGIAYTIDPYIVRGLDYYTDTAFEIVSNDIGSQSTVCGGGRYNGLVEQLEGPVTPGIGFGLGIERLLLVMESLKVEFPEEKGLDLFIIALGDQADKLSTKMIYELRKQGISCDKDHLSRSMKAQFKYSDKLNAQYTAIIGENEIENNVIVLKDMKNSTQENIDLGEFVNKFIQILK